MFLAASLAACPGPGPAETPDAGATHRPDAAAQAFDGSLPPGSDASTAGGDASVSAADASAAKPDAGASVDAGPITACSDIPADSCFSNETCAAIELCKSFDDTGVLRCCVAGARGSKTEGSTCTADSECAFGRCEVRDDGAKFCSGYCESDLECSNWMKCSGFFKWCYPRDANAPPASCAQISLDQCFYNDNCLANERCENKGTVAAEVLCCAVGARGTGAVGTACATELECTFGRCLGGLCSAACDIGADPCPPATMVCNEIRGMCEPL
jgi:hypothetical protein